jgi:hypothetical protein
MEVSDGRAALLREIFAQGFRTPDWRHAEPPPVVPAEMFFADNEDDECIAVNLEDHPGVEFFRSKLAAIAAKPEVAAVLVNIYDLDPVIYGRWPYAENVHILTSAAEEVVQAWAADLRSDGAAEGWPYGEPQNFPQAPEGQCWWWLSWD